MRQVNAGTRRLAVTLLAALGLVVTAAAPAVAAPEPGAGTATYLALGDSVPFGYRGPASGTAPDYSDPSSFVGYPEKIAADWHLDLLNASCPGETTESFMNTQALSNGCENRNGVPGGYRTLYPLHVDYGTESQLAYAEHVLETDHTVRLVTIQLGANDGFLCQANTADRCTSPAERADLAQRVGRNLDTILKDLRATGYSGPIVAVTYYALDYADPQGVSGVLSLNAGIATAAVLNGDRVASGFLAFLVPALRAGGSSVAAGLVLPNDVHPTDRGQRLLADAVEAVVGH